jgi:hypothetical protein
VLTKTTLAVAAIGAAAFLAPASSAPLAPPSPPVERLAQGVGHRHHHHHGHYYGHGHRQAHFLYGVPYTYRSYDAGNECYWLRRRVLYTGSSYWRERYYACLYEYGYN